MTASASVEKVAGFIVARVRGEPTAELLRETQAKVLSLIRKGDGVIICLNRGRGSRAKVAMTAH